MYKKAEFASLSPSDFELPSCGKLSASNRWVKMAQVIPWSEFESEYAENFPTEMGAPAKSWRMALGALIIKEKLGISDRETVEQIRENPYLQYFIGQSSYSNELPFDPSLLVHFRQRISPNLINKLNERMVEKMREITHVKTEKKKDSDAKNESPNRGKLIIDATCAPADISYPTDLGLLNGARVHTEKIIDILYKPLKGQIPKKPRTYRNLARIDYLLIAKQRRPTRNKRRQAIKKQLQYIKRNLAHIEQLIDGGASLKDLNKKQYKTLLVLTEVYRQQQWLFDNDKQSIEDRIVSLSQPHIRPIVRGKAGKSVEFGAKLSASCFEGYVFLDRMSWDNFNESGDLKAQVEAYHRFTGYYPESVHADRIYRTRSNRAWCKERGIRISGPPLGRPPANVSKEKKKQAAYDERIRNAIEGKFGQAKRRFGLNRVMAKLDNTSGTVIAITFLVMNLATWWRRVFCMFLCLFGKRTPIFGWKIIYYYNWGQAIQKKLIFNRD
ncbi:IS5 family transposase [Microcoleus vaginatus PCC 9802]|uniref:IS5 family transposase n=1 Tax=Microcoleus vaginatus TaxID=119532 RepID=UPI00020D2460|nr:transposase [Microcoleus vaginatus FGP-2]UNU18366.1 IS5 family transposase [Microcoleus vaginatus PCC 9802]